MSPELLTAIVASGSCVAICLMMLMLVMVLYRNDPLCCRFRPSRTERDEPPYHHTRHSLTSIPCNAHNAAMNQGATGPQLSGRLFVVGKPHDYHLNGAPPRLPSYESVRKMDRQRRIHSMISQRFGLIGCSDEPPTYEETLRQSVAIPPENLDVHPSVCLQDHNSDHNEDTHNPGRPSSSYCPAQSSRLPSV
ncbi:uncharacterized protein [Clinocottus analis]|uniref:uncharacterized protein isoform X2 n=1 Tax=Clinocottus analis TaxID=304258 RepID=UPI0035C0242E